MSDVSLSGIVSGLLEHDVGLVYVVKETLYTAELRRKRDALGVLEPFPVSAQTQIVGRCADHRNAVALLRMRINLFLQRAYNIDVLAFHAYKKTAVVNPKTNLMRYLSGAGGEWALDLPWEEDFEADGSILLPISLQYDGEEAGCASDSDDGGEPRCRWINVPYLVGDKAVFEILLERPSASKGSEGSACPRAHDGSGGSGGGSSGGSSKRGRFCAGLE